MLFLVQLPIVFSKKQVLIRWTGLIQHGLKSAKPQDQLVDATPVSSGALGSTLGCIAVAGDDTQVKRGHSELCDPREVQQVVCDLFCPCVKPAGPMSIAHRLHRRAVVLLGCRHAACLFGRAPICALLRVSVPAKSLIDLIVPLGKEPVNRTTSADEAGQIMMRAHRSGFQTPR